MHPQQPGQWGPPPGGQHPQQQPPYQQPPQNGRGKRIGLVAGLGFAVLVLVGAGGFLALEYVDYSKPAGEPPTNAALPPQCDLVGKPTLQRLHVTNPDPTIASEDAESGLASCGWGPTAGRDGIDERTLRVDVRSVPASGDVTETFETLRDSAPDDVTELPGLGEEAFLTSGGEGKSEVSFRQGRTIVTVGYSGRDKGFMGDSVDMSEAEAVQAVRAVAQEIAAKL